MEITEQDVKYMKLAIRLGLKGLGRTEPNPMVGAVAVQNHRIVSTGYHACLGGVHAERAALEQTDETGTTLYVPLEPCVHFGRTPPCTDIIIKKKVARVVCACQDPDPRVNGSGFAVLRRAGIEVVNGCLRDMYSYVNRHYFTWAQKKRPHVTLKAGVSVDGKLTDSEGSSRWVTSEQMRIIAHQMRGEFSAVMVGANTARTDNPGLNLRTPEWQDKKLFRVVLDSSNSLSPDLRIFKDQELFPLILFSGTDAVRKKKTANHFFVERKKHGLSLNSVISKLAEMEIASVMVEGGAALIDSFLQQDLWDELVFFTADKIIGGRDSLELFNSGRTLDRAVQIKNREVIELASGYMVRGFH